jgi:hypothetical protein
MMATATPTTPEKKRPGRPALRQGEQADPSITIRVPPAVLNGLRLWAKTKKTSVSDVVRDKFPGMAWYATELGQTALMILGQLVSLSTTVHKGTSEFAPEKGEPDEWNGLSVTRYGDDKTPRYVHNVRQREGDTRNDAVQRYAGDVWSALALMDSDEQRDDALRELRRDERHVFVIAYVGLRKWRTFPSALELQYYERYFSPRKQGREPINDDERRVYEYYAGWFEALLLDVAKPIDTTTQHPGRWVLWDGPEQRELRGEGDSTAPLPYTGGLARIIAGNALAWSSPGWVLGDKWFELKWYPDETPDEGVQRWARQMVAAYVEWLSAYTNEPTLWGEPTPELFIDEMRNHGYVVTSLQWLQPTRKTTT